MTKNSKKWLLNAVNGVLTLGASLTLGLLSFGGFYAIIPSIRLGLSSFSLATLYEGEIYNRNIKDALEKLLKPNYFNQKQAIEVVDRILALNLIKNLPSSIKETLSAIENKKKLTKQDKKILQAISIISEMPEIDKAKQLQENVDELKVKYNIKNLPAFFNDYKSLEDKCNKHSHSLAGIKAKNKARKKLKLMQRFFAKALFNESLSTDDYADKLSTYLFTIDNGKFQKHIIDQTKSKLGYIKAGLYFSILSAALFSIGSVYLILETLTTLTFITLSLPTILSLSALCGAAYGFLTYNALTDLIWNDTLTKWLDEIKSDINEGNILKVIASTILIVLAVTLTAFTFGTWVTIAKHSKNLPDILKKIPAFISRVLIPLIISIATLGFTLENTKKSLDEISTKIGKWWRAKGSLLTKIKKIFVSDNNKIDERPIYQKYNPFNAIIYVLETPLRIIGFILHIASIGVTTDRVDGVSKPISAGLSMLSEGFEDHHYFFGEDDSKEHAGHNHSNDIPTKIIKFALIPFYTLSVFYHSGFSQITTNKVAFKDAWRQRFSPNEIDDVCGATHQIDVPFNNQTDFKCQQMLMLMQLNDQLSTISGDDKLSLDKREVLKKIKDNIKATGSNMHEALNIDDASKAKLNQHRNFWHIPGEKTSSTEFIKSLQSQVAPTA